MEKDAGHHPRPGEPPGHRQGAEGRCRNYIGGNCTVSCMMMAVDGLLKADLVEWISAMTYQAASGGGAQTMRELLQQMGEVHYAAKAMLQDPNSPILDIDREVAGISATRASHRALRRAARGSLLPWIDSDLGNGQSREEWKGDAETNKILGRAEETGFRGGVCVRVGAMRCHSQGLHHQAEARRPARRDRVDPRRRQRVGEGRPEQARRDAEAPDARGRHGTLDIPIGRLRKLKMGGEYLSAFTVGDQLLWGAAEPLRRMLEILLGKLDRRVPARSRGNGPGSRGKIACKRSDLSDNAIIRVKLKQ
jgi:aspartate-semialdehyde dehydrogenase